MGRLIYQEYREEGVSDVFITASHGQSVVLFALGKFQCFQFYLRMLMCCDVLRLECSDPQP
jgi:hypothetical protein